MSTLLLTRSDIIALFDVSALLPALKEGFKLAKPMLVSRVIYSTATLCYALVRLGYIPFLGPTFDLLVSLGLCFQASLLAYVITDYRYKLEIGKLEEDNSGHGQCGRKD